MRGREHELERCQTPRTRRRRNMLWVCPVCDRPWVLRRSDNVPPRHWADPILPLQYSQRVWRWWPWGLAAASEEGSA